MAPTSYYFGSHLFFSPDIAMKHTDLDYFKRWFTEYVAQFYELPNGGIQPIIMKDQHTRRTCQEILLLGNECGLSDEDLLLAETAALFHDIGRFPQWKHYSTFVDSLSRDHALMGLEVISRHQVLKRISSEQREIIQQAIRHHNLRELPANLPSRQLHFSSILRDADKLDIWRVVIMHQEEGSNLVEALAGNIPLSNSYSSEILVELREMRAPDFSLVRNQNDMILLRLGWVFDLNFAPSCHQVLERNYIERLCSRLPVNKEIEEIKQHLISYLRDRITAGS